MVKGTTRRVIVVKPSDKMFEEAIFIVRDDPDESPGVTSDEVVKEAQRAARDFMRSNLGSKRGGGRRRAFWLGLGAAAASAFWTAALFYLGYLGS